MINSEKQIQELEAFMNSLVFSIKITNDIDLHFVTGWRFVKDEVNLCNCMFQLSHTYKLNSNSTHTIGFFRVKIEQSEAEVVISELNRIPGSVIKVDNVQEVIEFLSNNVDVAAKALMNKKFK